MLQPSSAADWIARLKLMPHPEGGYYRETYRSPLVVQSAEGDDRSAATSIYFLIHDDQFSALHRIKSDEIWHFYDGDPLLITGIHPDGRVEEWRLGTRINDAEQPQCVIPAGVWFGASLPSKGAYVLVGCTVSPGFDFADFEMADRAALTAVFPQHANLITRLTR